MVLINQCVDEKINCLLSGPPRRLSDEQVVCVLGAGSRTRERYTVKRLWDTASLHDWCSSRESAFAFERLFYAGFPVGSVINEDINGETRRQCFP